MNDSLLPIVVTPGEPAGIGPDLVLQLACLPRAAPLVAIADPALMAQRAELLGLDVRLPVFSPGADIASHVPGLLPILPVPLGCSVAPGVLNPANAGYVLETLTRAVDGCLGGEFRALVTGPVHKGVINQAGIPFTGHTEYLAQRAGAERVVMMLATPGLRVALATTHLRLRDVARAITPRRLEGVIRVLVGDLRARFGLPRPRVLVCGLNPHAGEGGHLGREEVQVMIPVLDALRGEGMDLVGPVPADTAFLPERLRATDAVLAMYHDQGLPVLKHLGFGHAVNVTLGLPFLRTSVDHGTALDLAGSGRADGGSLEAAMEMATEMARSGKVAAER